MVRQLMSRAAAIAIVLSGGCALAPATESSPTISPAVVAAVAQGRARVLVELRTAAGFRPEGHLPGPDAIASQRAAIAAAQQSVIAGLHGTDAVVLQRYASAPFLALEIGPSALRAIEGMASVARVVEDTVNLPSGGRIPRSVPEAPR
jgi:hypothetical protein